MDTENTKKKTIFDRLPTPKQIISIVLICGIIGVALKMWPYLLEFIFGDYRSRGPQDTGIIIIGSTVVNVLLFLLLLGVWNVRGIWWPFMKASMFNSIVLIGFTKNKLVSFIVPKEINWNHIKPDSESTIDPDPDSRYTAPNKVPVLPFIPDYAKTIDPRSLLLNKDKDFSIDMTTLDQVGRINRLIGYERANNPLKGLGTGLIIIIMAAGVLFMVLWPQFSQQMNQQGTITSLENKVLVCNNRLVENGLQPVGVDLSQADPNKPQEAKPATGVETK